MDLLLDEVFFYCVLMEFLLIWRRRESGYRREKVDLELLHKCAKSDTKDVITEGIYKLDPKNPDHVSPKRVFLACRPRKWRKQWPSQSRAHMKLVALRIHELVREYVKWIGCCGYWLPCFVAPSILDPCVGLLPPGLPICAWILQRGLFGLETE